jgi:hypothetical protein
MMSESLITKETSLPDIRLENNDFEKIRVGPYVTNTKLILVDLVDDDEEIRVHELGCPQLTMRDLKKRKELFTHLYRIDHHFHLTLHWLGNRINYQ